MLFILLELSLSRMVVLGVVRGPPVIPQWEVQAGSEEFTLVRLDVSFFDKLEAESFAV